MTVYIFLYFCHNTYHRYICPVLHNNRLPDSYPKTSFVVGRIGGTYVRADFSRIYRTMFRFYYCRRTNRSYDRPFYYSQICRNYPHSRSYIAVRRHHILGNRTWKPVLSFSLEYPIRHPVSDSVRALFRDFPWWMDHGPGRDGRYFPYLCQKKQIPERSFFYNPVHSRRQNCRSTDLLL